MTAETQLREAAWLNEEPLARLLALLDRDGEEARVVGGAVRDAMLSLPIREVDIATTAEPAEVVRRVKAAGGEAVPTGIEHGTVTAIFDRRSFEVTTLREDVETFGRKARVKFGRDWKADAERRDFTINALSATRAGTVHDYVGGLADIAAQRVRFIGEPERRIEEDYLRILRFFRFHAYFAAGEPDEAGLAACIKERGGLDTLSRERVRAELMKLLLAPRAAPVLGIMTDAGLLGPLLGGVPYIASFARMVQIEKAVGAEPDAVRRLGALGVMFTEDEERLTQRLRLSNAEAARLAGLESWWRIRPTEERAARALLYRLGPQLFLDRVLVAWTRSGEDAADNAWRELADLPQRWPAPTFVLKAADFIRRGVPAGPSLGNALRAAEAAWIDADFPGEPAAIDAIADRIAREWATLT